MPVGIIDTEAIGHLIRGPAQLIQRGHGLMAHLPLDFAAFPVELIQPGGVTHGHLHIVGQQAFDALRHVGEASGGIQPRSNGIAQITGHQALGTAPGHLQ